MCKDDLITQNKNQIWGNNLYILSVKMPHNNPFNMKKVIRPVLTLQHLTEIKEAKFQTKNIFSNQRLCVLYLISGQAF